MNYWLGLLLIDCMSKGISKLWRSGWFVLHSVPAFREDGQAGIPFDSDLTNSYSIDLSCLRVGACLRARARACVCVCVYVSDRRVCCEHLLLNFVLIKYGANKYVCSVAFIINQHWSFIKSCNCLESVCVLKFVTASIWILLKKNLIFNVIRWCNISIINSKKLSTFLQ